MAMSCPRCGAQIAVSDVNVQQNVALCRACKSLFGASELAHGAPLVRDLSCPPGAWDTRDGDERRLGATTRSGAAFFLVPFMCVWSGGSLGGIYGMQIATRHFSLGLSLFGIPFVLGTLLFGTIALMSVLGRVEVRIRGDEGVVFTGVGPLGWTRRFSLSDFGTISEVFRAGRHNSSQNAIVLEGARRLEFGSMLSTERRYFLMESLRPLLRPNM